MRSYIFTESELECLIDWLRTGRETRQTTVTLSRIREKADRLAVHLEIMILCLKKMKQEGRLVGRMRLPSELATRVRSLSEG